MDETFGAEGVSPTSDRPRRTDALPRTTRPFRTISERSAPRPQRVWMVRSSGGAAPTVPAAREPPASPRASDRASERQLAAQDTVAGVRRITVDGFDGHVDDREGGRIDAGWDVVDAVGAQRPERDELGHGRIDQPQLQVPVVGIEPLGLQIAPGTSRRDRPIRRDPTRCHRAARARPRRPPWRRRLAG